MKGSELAGKALGLIGFGRIAQSVGRVAQAIGMEVHAYDPYLPPKIAKAQEHGSTKPLMPCSPTAPTYPFTAT